MISKEKFDAGGVATPKWETIAVGERPKMPLPIVIKAPREGSTVGVYIVKKEAELEHALKDGAKYAQRSAGRRSSFPARELTVGVLGDQALPIIEIIAKEGFYDFAEKYPFLNPRQRRRRRAARLPGAHSGRADARDPGTRVARVPFVRAEGLRPRRCDAAGERRADRPRDQHHSRA